MDECQFSLMRIVSDVEIIDGNPWWCKDFGTLNHPKPRFVENWFTHVCYPKHWTDGIGQFICSNLDHWDQIILRSEKELTWRCIPFEFWCPYKSIRNFNECMDIIVIFVSFVISALVIPQAIEFISKGIELLVNRLVYGTWTAPQPVILPMFWPKPAPAA